MTQTETNLERSAVTNETGGFNLPNLLPGAYQIAVTLAGFQTYTARDVAVGANIALRLDVRMNVGEVKESVVVSGAGGRVSCSKPGLATSLSPRTSNFLDQTLQSILAK